MLARYRTTTKKYCVKKLRTAAEIRGRCPDTVAARADGKVAHVFVLPRPCEDPYVVSGRGGKDIQDGGRVQQQAVKFQRTVF